MLRKLIVLVTLTFCLINGFSQQIVYSDLLNLKNIPDSINPNTAINCDKYFSIEDKVHDDSWVNKYFSLPEIIGGFDSIERLIEYPKTNYKYCKNKCIAHIRFVIDSNGIIICHEILTSLPQEYKNEIEKIIPFLKFRPALNINKKPVPCDVLMKYEFKKNKLHMP